MFKEMFIENLNEKIFNISSSDRELYIKELINLPEKIMRSFIKNEISEEIEDVVNYSREGIDGKNTKHSVSVSDWYDSSKGKEKITAGWLEYSDDMQGRAFDFLKLIYKKDTSVKLRHKTEYILNDILMTYGSGNELQIKKQAFSNENDVVKFVGKTVNGDNIAFDPSKIAKK